MQALIYEWAQSSAAVLVACPVVERLLPQIGTEKHFNGVSNFGELGVGRRVK